MVSKDAVDEQLKRLDFSLSSWGRAEIRELPHILLPGEEIYELVNGIYEGGFALIVATDVRLLLIDKKPMNYLTVEDIRFDMISEIDYSHRLLGAQINISTGYKDLKFRSYNQPRLRKLIGHVQHCMADSKRKQSENQVGQNQHLEHLNEQLRDYLKAQSEYQSQLQQFQQAQQNNGLDVPVPSQPTPSHELSDYLFARSLLAQYEKQTGQKLEADIGEDPLKRLGSSQQLTVFSNAPLQTKRELHELWDAGVAEVFGKHSMHKKSKAKLQKAEADPKRHNSFEINPASIVFSRLPMLIRSRKLIKPIATKLSSGTNTA